MKDNLYIIGFPRGMTTVVHTVCSVALNRIDNNVSAGEYLNPDRVSFPFSAKHSEIINSMKKDGYTFWSNKDKNKVVDILNDIHDNPKKIVFKDVLYPHITADWIEKNNANCLIVRKEIPLTAFSLIRKGWFYPTRYLYDEDPKGIERVKALLESLKTMKQRFDELLGTSDKVREINTDKMLSDRHYIFRTLEDLGYKTHYINYMIPKMKQKQIEVQAYKDTQMYNDIVNIWNDINE